MKIQKEDIRKNSGLEVNTDILHQRMNICPNGKVYQEEKKRKRHTVLNTIQKRKVPCLKHT
jgi:hypothetical protein